MAERRAHALRDAEEALDAGASTLEQLSGQGEQLDRAENLTEGMQYDVAVARRMTRGMTWSGWLVNMVTSEPLPPQRVSSSSQVAAYQRGYNQQQRGQLDGHVSSVATGGSGGEGPICGAAGWATEDVSVTSQLKAQDAYLERQLDNVERLADMSSALGSAVESQNRQLEGLGSTVEGVHDETRSVIRMQGRLHRSVRGKVRFLANVVIVHVQSGRYLQVHDDGAVGLSPASMALGSVPYTARWEMHERGGDGVAGLRSVARRYWLGQTVLGSIRCKGASFGGWENWETPAVDGRPGPLLCCSANLSTGGWTHLDKKGVLVAASTSVDDKNDAPKWRVLTAADGDMPALREALGPLP